MFGKIKSILKGVFNKMLNKNTIAKELDVDIEVNNEMINAIELWSNMYNNKPPWLDENISSMGLPGAIANELARLVTIEFKSEVNNNDFINEEYQKLLSTIRINCEYACAKGGIVFKPYINDEHILIDVIQMDKFFPTEYNSNGDITGAVFIDYETLNNKIYTRLEYHHFKDDIYIISNKAYVKESKLDKSLGKPVDLSEVNRWSNIEKEVGIKNITKPLFSYFKIPQANTIDNDNPMGVSVYNKAIDLIKEADKQYSRILWEYEGSELAINASESLFKLNNKGEPKIPERNKRLFRVFDFEGKNSDKLLDTFSPEIRDSSLFNGLNNLLRRIEFNCGLAYGTLSDVNDADKTATEIKASKQRSYSTVKDIQKALEDSLKNVVESMNNIAKLYELDNSNIDVSKDISFQWDDSLVLDKDSELESMRNDVAAGILRPEIYLANKYGVSEEEALKMMPPIEDSIKNKSPYDEE